MKYPKQHHRFLDRGFTLIGLLVVIAVIAVLMAILFPALRAARTLAKRIQCASQLRQIGMAWTMYLNDSDGRFYQGINTNLSYGGWEGHYRWTPRPLNPYLHLPADLNDINQAGVFCCPVDRGGTPNRYARYQVHYMMGNSYGTNVFLVGQTANGKFSDRTAALDLELSRRNNGISALEVKNPCRLLLLGDYGWFNQWDPGLRLREDYKELAEWHRKENRFNMLFLDGHVRFQEIKKGYYVTEDYTVVPYEDLYPLAVEVQGPSL